MVPGKQPGELRLSEEHLQPDARGVSIAFGPDKSKASQ